MQYARSVHFTLKPGKVEEFNRLMKNEIIPTFKKQKGFHDHMLLLQKENGLSITVWDDKPTAEAYHANAYPEILKKLHPVLEGTPRVEYFDVHLTPVHA